MKVCINDISGSTLGEIAKVIDKLNEAHAVYGVHFMRATFYVGYGRYKVEASRRSKHGDFSIKTVLQKW